MDEDNRARENCDRLFAYLRSILYDKEIQPLDVKALDESFQKLGLGMQFLAKAVGEMKEYSAAISKGDLSAPAPGKENFLCENIKNIGANLRHLTWQAKQVAKGDYSQHVSYLGEFSDAFNTMTAQLREREQAMQAETQREKEHADMTQRYNLLLLNLIRHSKESIVITAAADGRILYDDTAQLNADDRDGMLKDFYQKLTGGLLTPFSTESMHDMVWEAELSGGRFFRITTVAVEWDGAAAYAHIIMDVTENRLEQSKLMQAAYFDKLTQIGNRSYFEHCVQELLQMQLQMLVCYCDLDGLKYVNDSFGHGEGDFYLRSFVETVKARIREKDIFARLGGDEFCVVLKNCPSRNGLQKMRSIQQAFSEIAPEKPYEKGFSFGLIEIPADHGEESLESILKRVDYEMYLQKRERKKLRQ